MVVAQLMTDIVELIKAGHKIELRTWYWDEQVGSSQTEVYVDGEPSIDISYTDILKDNRVVEVWNEINDDRGVVQLKSPSK